MKKIFFTILTVSFLLPSCVSQKKYAALEAMNQQSKDLLNSATVKLNSCIDEKAGAEADLKTLKEQVAFLKNNNQDLINNMGNLTTLSQKGAWD
jgi:chemotaxis protein MotB